MGGSEKSRKDIVMKKTLIVMLFAAVLAGCTTTQKVAAIGGLSGAALGGIIGHQSGRGGTGAAIGAAAGTVGGMIVGEKMEKKFCPACGAGYTSGQEYCPKDGTELKEKQ